MSTSTAFTTVQDSVPSEILEIIFDNLVKTTVPEERPWTAVILTHVCRLFRQTALDCPRLWTSLGRKRGRPGLALIEACIERSKDHPLDVFISVYGLLEESEGAMKVGQVAVDSMAETILSSCTRWKSFYARAFVADGADHSQSTKVVSLLNFHSLYKSVDAPMLEIFTIVESSITSDNRAIFTSFDRGFQSLLSENPSWNIPNLHSLVLHNSDVTRLPFTLESWKFVTITYEKEFCYFKELPLFASASSLESLHLNLYNCNVDARYSVEDTTVFPNVKFMQLDLRGCAQTWPGKRGLWLTFRTLRFPDVVHLKVGFDIGDATFMFRNELRAFDTTLFSLLGSQGNDLTSTVFPNVETLEIEASLRESDGGGLGEGVTVFFPEHCLAKVKDLRIQSDFKLMLTVAGGNMDDAEFMGSMMVMESITSTALQTITLEVPQPEGIIEWMRLLMQSMQEQGCWHGFSELILSGGEGDKQVLLRDEVERWCQAA